MSIDTKQIQKLATLSRLQFSAEELPAFASKFENILNFVSQIQQLNTAGVPPLTSTATMASSPEREDKVTQMNSREALQKSAPKTEMGFYVVPRIVE